MTVHKNAFTIGTLAKRTGCNIETVRYYERIGLLAKPHRSSGGHRLYGDGDVRLLGFIRRSRGLGFSLDDVRALLALVESKSFTCLEVKSLTERHLSDVERKIAELKKLEHVLNEMIVQCQGGRVPDCPIVDALMESAE